MKKTFDNVFRNAKVLVTGHTGFKGSWLSLWLSHLGADVTGISLDVPTEPSHFLTAQLGDLMHDSRMDVRDGAGLKKAIKEVQPDFVFHLAAQPIVRRSYDNPVETWSTNTFGTVNVLEALRELKKSCAVVLITSDKCYDNVEWTWGYRETDALGGPDPYSASKGAAELAIRSYVRSYFPQDGLVRLAVGRAGNVIGGGDWAADRIVPDCVRSWSRGGTVQLRNPHATRPWQHVLEPLSGYLTLAMALSKDSKVHGEPFNFGPPAQQNHSVGELVTSMSKHWEDVKWEDVSSQNDGPHECGLLKLNCDKALHHLRWQAVWNFDETVRATALWFRTYYGGTQGSMRDFSEEQISLYTSCAQERGQPWAR